MMRLQNNSSAILAPAMQREYGPVALHPHLTTGVPLSAHYENPAGITARSISRRIVTGIRVESCDEGHGSLRETGSFPITINDLPSILEEKTGICEAVKASYSVLSPAE
jgi:hypothetical protein